MKIIDANEIISDTISIFSNLNRWWSNNKNGDCILASNTVDNFGTETYKPSIIQVTFMKPIDVPSNGLWKYNDEDRGCSFHYRLANIKQIT